MRNESGPDIDAITIGMLDQELFFPPMVVFELLCDPTLGDEKRRKLDNVDLLFIKDGFWQRAGLLRSKVVGRKRKARSIDALIAQSCIDHNVPLITRDNDFRHYEEFGLYIII